MTAAPDAFKDIVPLLAPSCSTLPCSRHTIYDVCAGGEFLSPLRECAADTVEPHLKKNSPGSITYRSQRRQTCWTIESASDRRFRRLLMTHWAA